MIVSKEFEKMLMGHKTQDVTDRYIRVSEEMRFKFYEYVELIVGEKKKTPLILFKAS